MSFDAFLRTTLSLLIWKIADSLCLGFCIGRMLCATYTGEGINLFAILPLEQLCPVTQKTEHVIECWWLHRDREKYIFMYLKSNAWC